MQLRPWASIAILALGTAAAGARWRPEPAMRMLARLLPAGITCFADTNSGIFALTFDDGPHPDVTPALLDVLARHQARATFFLIGERVRGNESVVARIAAEGHELANHLMYDEPSVRLSGLEFSRQLVEVSSCLTPYGDVRWFRPGSGWVTPRMLRQAAQAGLRCALGTVVAVHTGGAGDARIGRHLSARIRPGTIAVLHEGTAARQGVVATTDLVLARLARLGLTAVTVSELVGAPVNSSGSCGGTVISMV